MKRANVNGVSHRWLIERNREKDVSKNGKYLEIELSELLYATFGCELISVYIHTGGGVYGIEKKDSIHFLQADAFCLKNDSKIHYFILPFPSLYDGGYGREHLSETMPGTVWDDIILRFENESDDLLTRRQLLSPTWIAAVRNDEVVELYGNLLDYSKAFPYLPAIMNERAAFDFDFSDFAFYDDLYPLLGWCDFPASKGMTPEIRKRYFKFYRGENNCPDEYYGLPQGRIWSAERGAERIWGDLVSGRWGDGDTIESRLECFISNILGKGCSWDEWKEDMEYYRNAGNCTSV